MPNRSVVIDLSGTWRVREALGETWRWHVGDLAGARNNAAEAAAAVAAAPGWLPAHVPGSVIDDLVRAEEVPEPRVGRASRDSEWVADRAWVFRRIVDLPTTADDELVALELDGVDPGATIVWDGAELGTVSGLYESGRFPLTGDARRPGAHTLAIVVYPVPESEPQVGRTERVRVHTPRMGYGWDFCPRLRHQGIWQEARIVIGATRLTAAHARATLSSDMRQGTVTVHATVATGDPERRSSLRVRAELLLDDAVIASASEGASSGSAHVTLTVADPEPWWPNGLGAQTLYTVRITAGADERALPVGFRTLEFVHNEDAAPGSRAYTAVVNGRTVPLTGWNWVPTDALFGAAPTDRLHHLVDLAARSGARLLRVWGGGLIETEAFYRACDRAGLLVWQEFSQSSSGMQSVPSDDPAFVAALVRDADQVIPARTHHPSLAIWGGGNELDADGVPLDESRSPALAALADAVRRLDPGRHWLPTSPTGPEFHNRLDRIAAAPEGQHDVHGPWEHQGLEEHQTLYNAGTSLAHTEFGVEGMTNRRALDAVVPADVRWPADRTNPVYRHLGEWWNNAPFVDAAFGARLTSGPDDLEALGRASRWLQATGLQYAVEADRRRWPHCSMVLPWQLGESFPNAWCTSSVDFFGEPKPAYWAVRRAFRSRRATIRVERTAWAGHAAPTAEVWLWSEETVPESTLVIRGRDGHGTVIGSATITVDAIDRPRAVGSLAVALDAVPDRVLIWEAVWTSADGTMLDRELQVASTGADLTPLLDLPAPTLRVVDTVQQDVLTVRVRNDGEVAAISMRLVDGRDVHAAGWFLGDGDPRPLLPGEERTLFGRWTGEVGAVGIEVWNGPAVPIDPTRVGAEAV